MASAHHQLYTRPTPTRRRFPGRGSIPARVGNTPARAFRRFPRDQIWCPFSSYSCKCARTAQTSQTAFQSFSFQSLVHPEMSNNVDEPRPAEQGNVNLTQQPANDIDWSQLYDMFMKIEQRLPNFDHMLMAMNDYAFQRWSFSHNYYLLYIYTISCLMTE